MSWDPWIKNMEDGEGKCNYAFLASDQGVFAYTDAAKSPIPVNPAELQKVIDAVKGKTSDIQQTGAVIGGIKFTCIKAGDSEVVLQGLGANKNHAFVATATNTLVIGGYNNDEAVKPQTMFSAVCKTADALKNVGY